MSRRPGARAARPGGRDEQAGLPFAVSTSPAPRLAMEVSTPCSSAFDSDDWVFGVDWEGARALLVAGPDGSVQLQGETVALADRFPEIAAGAARTLRRPAVLDGTVCVLDALGRPDLEGLCERAASGARRPAAVYLAADLLRLDGVDLSRRPLRERLAVLADAVGPEAIVQAPEHVVGNGSALAEAAAERGLAAILARRLDSPYRAGVASPDRLRVALTARRDAIVVGLRRRSSLLNVVLGEWSEGHIRVVTTVPVTRAPARAWLEASVEAAPAPPVNEPEEAGQGVRWLRPRLVATIEPAVAAGADVRSWRLVAVRDDVDPRWCVRRAAASPPSAPATHPQRAFSPTVLSPLPLGGAA